MKNEDKAMEICQNMCLCEHCAKLQFCKSNKHARCFHFIKTEKAVLEMAQWKDEQAKRQFIDKAWQWIFRVFVITAPLDFQQAIEKEFRKEMKGE